jgi:hypothetical protein
MILTTRACGAEAFRLLGCAKDSCKVFAPRRFLWEWKGIVGVAVSALVKFIGKGDRVEARAPSKDSKHQTFKH